MKLHKQHQAGKPDLLFRSKACFPAKSILVRYRSGVLIHLFSTSYAVEIDDVSTDGVGGFFIGKRVAYSPSAARVAIARLPLPCCFGGIPVE
jgi:hypothetical protein